MLSRVGVEHAAASQGVRRGDLADHKAIAIRGDQRLLQPQLPEAASQPGQTRRRLPGAVMHLDPLAVLGLAREKLELRVY